MDKPPEYTLEVSADRAHIRDVVIGLLHVICFHRCFMPLQPATQDILDMTLPYVSEDDIENLIETKTNAFIRQVEASTVQAAQSQPKPGRGTLVVNFQEKKRKNRGWFVAKADEETVWETWVIDVTLTSARSEPEAARNRRQMEAQLQTAAMTIVETVNRERDHIPPITSNDSNFPFQIMVNPKPEVWSPR